MVHPASLATGPTVCLPYVYVVFAQNNKKVDYNEISYQPTLYLFSRISHLKFRILSSFLFIGI